MKELKDSTKYFYEKTQSFNIRFMKDDVLLTALLRASEEMNIKPTRYIKIALRDKLRFEGYLNSGDIVTIKGPGRKSQY